VGPLVSFKVLGHHRISKVEIFRSEIRYVQDVETPGYRRVLLFRKCKLRGILIPRIPDSACLWVSNFEDDYTA
jgi:hypothetical protein